MFTGGRNFCCSDRNSALPLALRVVVVARLCGSTSLCAGGVQAVCRQVQAWCNSVGFFLMDPTLLKRLKISGLFAKSVRCRQNGK